MTRRAKLKAAVTAAQAEYIRVHRYAPGRDRDNAIMEASAELARACVAMIRSKR